MAQKRQTNPGPKGEERDRLARRGTGTAKQGADPPKSRPPGVPRQDAFQNLPRRKEPTHLEVNRSNPKPQQEVSGEAEDESKRNNNEYKEEKHAKHRDKNKEEQREKRRERRQQSRANPTLRRRRRRVLLTVIMLLIIAAGLVFSFNVLFPIRYFSIEGESQYTEAEILQVLNLEVGDNLLGFSLTGAQERLLSELPYLEEVEVRRKLPETVVLRLTPAQERYCFPWEDGWAITSQSLRVLRTDENQPEGLTAIYGLSDVEVVVGEKIALGEEGTGFSGSFEDYQALQAPPPEAVPSETPPIEDPALVTAEIETTEDETTSVEGAAIENTEVDINAAIEEVSSEVTSEVTSEISSEIIEEEGAEGTSSVTSMVEEEAVNKKLVELEDLVLLLEELGFTDVTWVDISDPLSLRVRIEDRVTIKLGAPNHLRAKLEFVATLMLEGEASQITQGDRGVLDASGYPLSTDRIWFSPD